MKKYHLYLWIIALIGMITSCSQNETDALQNANNKMVSITASLPVDFVQPNPAKPCSSARGSRRPV